MPDGVGFNATPQTFHQKERDLVPTVQDVGWAPGLTLMGAESLASPHQDSVLGLYGTWWVTIPTTVFQSLYQLQCSIHYTNCSVPVTIPTTVFQSLYQLQCSSRYTNCSVPVTIPTTVFQPRPNDGCIKLKHYGVLKKQIFILILICTLVVRFECTKFNVQLQGEMQLTLRIEHTPSTTDVTFEQCYTCTPMLPHCASIGKSRGNLFILSGKVTEKHAAMFCSC